MTPQRSLLLSAILVALSSSLTACGGGGGNVKEAPVNPVVVTPPTDKPTTPPVAPVVPPVDGTKEPTPPIDPPKETPPAPEPVPPVVVVPPPVAPPVVVPPPYNPNAPLPAPNPLYRPHLDYTHAADAQAQGYTGQGIKIGIIDSGVNIFHPALNGKVVAETTTTTGANTATNDPFGHGTKVAQIIAGDHIGRFQGGVAYDADLYISRSLNSNGHVQGAASGMAWMNSQGVKIVNNSWNVPVYLDPSQPVYITDPFIDDARDLINNNGLVVFANGNEGRDQPGLFSLGPAAFPELEKGWLTVGAVKEDSNFEVTDTLAFYSNACGAARNWCLVAPGYIAVMLPSYEGNQPYYNPVAASGTSFAAPQVSAAAALVWQAYPWMTNDQVRKTILGTARDIGAPGVDAVFGYGALDTGKAVNGFGSLEWGTETFDVTAGSYTFGNAISGTGGLIKDGVGTLVLSKNSTYTGTTEVHDGTLSITGSVAGNVLTQGASSHLLLSGRIGGNVDNQGHATSVGGRVDGDWLQGSEGTFSAVLGAATEVGGRFTADGTLNIAGTASSDYVVKQTETLVKAHDVNGAFAATTFAAGLFMTGNVRYTADTVELDVAQASPTSMVFMMATPQAASNAQQLEQAFAVGERVKDSAADSESPGTPAGAFLAGLAQAQRVTTEAEALAVANTLSGQGRALAASALLATQQTQDAVAFGRLGAVALTEAGVFASAARNETRFSPNGWSTTRLQSNDVTGGMDWDIGSARLGVVGQSSRGDLSMSDNLGHYRLTSKSLGLYGQQAMNHGWSLMGQLRTGNGKLDGDRMVALGPQAGAVENVQRFDQWSTAVRLEKAWEGTAGTWAAYAGLSYHSQTQKGSEDRGNTGFEQGTLSQTFASTGTQVGGRYASMKQVIGNWGFSWEAGAEYAHRNERGDLALTSYYLVDPTAQNRLEGTYVGQNTWRAFAQARVNQGNFSAFVQADTTQGSDMKAWGVEAGVKLSW